MARPKCNRDHFNPRFKKAKAACKRVEGDMQPLCNHIIRMAASSMKHGYCQRAGSELSKAIRMAKKYPKR